MEGRLQSCGGKQFVRSTEVVRFSEFPLSEVPLYIYTLTKSYCVITVARFSHTDLYIIIITTPSRIIAGCGKFRRL